MKKSQSKYLIVGSGLSGLTAAYILYKSGETDFLILESRDRVGGRILTKNGIDLGATWFQNHHQEVIDLLEELGVKKHYQYSEGKSILVYSSMAPAHYFQNDPNAPAAYRIAGGTKALVGSLYNRFRESIHLNTTLQKIENQGKFIDLSTSQGTYTAEKVVIAIPPRIVNRIHFTPELPETLTQSMENTHTWMSNAIKVGLTFKKPFWRERGYSGMMIGQLGCVTELYDHSNRSNTEFSLMGFVNEALRELTINERKSKILDYLEKYLGSEVLNYTSYHEKDWSQDQNTSCTDIKSLYMSSRYGDPQFDKTYLGGKLAFAGAETSPHYGGYMDGAIFAGKRAVDNLHNA